MTTRPTTRAQLPTRKKSRRPRARDTNNGAHSPLAQDDPDQFQDNVSMAGNSPAKLSFYDTDDEWEVPPSQLNLGDPGDGTIFADIDADIDAKANADINANENANANENGYKSSEDDEKGNGFGIEYTGVRKKKWKTQDFMKQLEENERNTPSIGSGVPKAAVFGVLFAIFAGIAIYVNTAKGGYHWQGFATGGDDDDDNRRFDDDIVVIEQEGGSIDTQRVPVPPEPIAEESHAGATAGGSSPGSNSHAYHFDPNAASKLQEAFHVSDKDWYGGVFSDPPHPSIPSELLHHHGDGDDDGDYVLNDNIGYMQNPNVFNNTIVFCSEGDVYLTSIPERTTGTVTNSSKRALPAMRLTSTVGNVNTPTINPKYPYLIAFTATYTGHREVYLMDLRSNHRSRPSMRLTYMDSEYGVLSVVGWEDQGTTLVVSTFNMEVAMEDQRLYKIGVVQKQSNNTNTNGDDQHGRLAGTTESPITVSSVKAVPLSQAIDSTFDDDSNCRYFTRFKQSSNTIRYVGGTAESLWAYCDGQDVAVPLTQDYVGTSKSPQIYTNKAGQKYLFFLSDRADVDGDRWAPATMNLWAAPLPKLFKMYKNPAKDNMGRPVKLTSISCIDGMSLQEFAIDAAKSNIVLRIGADLHSLSASEVEDALSQKSVNSFSLPPQRLPIAIYSDFYNLHERIIPLLNPSDVKNIDVFEAGYGVISALMTARGQLFVNPVVKDVKEAPPYGGGGMTIPPRRYRVAPGSTTGGMVRIMGSWYVPGREDDSSRTALILATDPLSATAELAFYLIDAAAASQVHFTNVDNLPTPLIGGHVSGGSVSDGGLGSINVKSVAVSPCGRRVVWTDTEGGIRAMNLPLLGSTQKPVILTFPKTNEKDEPLLGVEAGLTFSPSGRYVAIEHNARNQFRIISIADLGNPDDSSIVIKRIAQATPDRFNSISPFWGQAPVDFQVEKLLETSNNPPVATTLYFLSDRDVILTGNASPWGTRAPSPFFDKKTSVYALPLVSYQDELEVDPVEEIYRGSYVGGGALELMGEKMTSWSVALETTETTETNSTVDAGEDDTLINSSRTPDIEISFGPDNDNLSLARRAYGISEIPPDNYLFLHQLKDDPSFIMAKPLPPSGYLVSIFSIGDFPDNKMSERPINFPTLSLQSLGVSTNREYLYFTYSGKTKVVTNDATGLVSNFVGDPTFSKSIVDTDRWAATVWPKLEYQQMYADAWRMLRDYYYTADMGKIDWPTIYSRYLPLVARCGRREELDDVLKQMAAELSALHVFVYGGEYNDPLHGSLALTQLNEVASLGAVLERSAEWGGYVVKEIPESDPDFGLLDGKMVYSPLSDRTLKISGQAGLLSGDVIVAVNGESVMNVPDIHMLLRGMSGRSVRLDVLRVNSKSSFTFNRKRRMKNETGGSISSEPIIAVPISAEAASNLRYASWEWKTRELAKRLAKEKSFTVGYMHLRSMSGAEGEDAFVRGLYPDYNKQALIVDVRHNHGGNIDSWLLDSLQRKAWSFWQGRATNITNGGLGWDEQFAFRGHIVVLIDEKTSSDGEGFSRGMSELGLGKLVGVRTWGGGIWLSSDNHLVDGGIATAPEIGTYNNKFGWGLGIENLGVQPDVEVDNNPRTTFDGRDEQMEAAIDLLKNWLEAEPMVLPIKPGPHKDMSLQKEFEACNAN